MINGLGSCNTEKKIYLFDVFAYMLFLSEIKVIF